MSAVQAEQGERAVLVAHHRRGVVLASVLLVAFVAASGVAWLQTRADAARRADLHLAQLAGLAFRLSALEWEAIAKQQPNPELAEEIYRTGGELHSGLQEVGNDTGSPTLHGATHDYLTSLDEEVQLLAAEKLDEARRVDEERVDPSFERLREEIAVVRAACGVRAERAGRCAIIGSVFMLMSAAVVIGLLFWQFERARREAALLTGEQRVLRRSEERFRAMVQNAGDVIAIIDAGGAMRYLSPSIHPVLGHRAEELIGQGLFTYLPDDEVVAAQRMLAEALDNPARSYSHELRFRHADGSWRSLSVIVNNLLALPSVGGIVVNARDVTESRRVERALRERAAALARSNAELEQFAYVASHDLQEPLRMITSYTQLLARRYRGKLDADADEFITHAVEGAARMQCLIDDLLTYSRVGTTRRKLAPTDCKGVLSQALANLEVAIAGSGATVTHGPLPRVMGEAGQLTQLFQNLIGNAIKYRGREAPRVRVSAEHQGDDWVFAIRDNGIGIDPQYAERIFLIFQRLHTRAEYPGSGIGLAVCKKIVECHGGRIWVESAEGQGATFFFTLPVRGTMAEPAGKMECPRFTRESAPGSQRRRCP